MLGSGRFIAVEGGEGVGKSVFTGGLAERLRASGRTLIVSREPGGTPVADAIRQLFAAPPSGEKLSFEAEALLVSAARAQHVTRVIKPALAAGSWVLCDRFADSTRVYQGALGGLVSARIEELIQFSTGGLAPDLTFVLDCPVDVSVARLSRRAAGASHDAAAIGRYDDVTKQEHAVRREAYLALQRQDPSRRILISAEAPPEAMVAAAWAAVEERFGKN